MKLDKSSVLKLLRDRGDHDKADQAARELPDEVDSEKDSNLLGKFGFNPQDLVGKFGGVFGKKK
jgi:hypothetical protein